MSKYSDTIITAKPIAFWRMADTGSVMVDEMGNHNGSHIDRVLGTIGAIVGDDTLSSEYTSANVSGSQIPLHVDFTSPSFSFEFWINFDTNALLTYQYMLSQQDSDSTGGNRFAFTMGNNAGDEDALRFHMNNGSWTSVVIALPFAESLWYHIAVSYDDTLSLAKIYVNGVLSGTLSLSSLTVPTVPMTVASLYGNTSTDSFPLDANIQDIAYYNRAITELEVLQHWLIGRRYGSNYEYEVMKSNPLSYWRMNDANGNQYAMDEIAHRQLNPTGNPVSGVTPLITEGTCYDFSSTYLNANQTYDLSSDQLTVEVWIEIDTIGARNYIMTREDTAQNGYMQFGLEIVSGGSIRFLIQNGTTNVFFHVETASGIINTEQTYHIVATWNKNAFDATDCNIYVNGTIVPAAITLGGGTYNDSFNLLTQSGLIEIARRTWEPANVFNGRIDQVALYNREISAAEVTLHYNAGTGVYPVIEKYDEMIENHGAIHHWKFTTLPNDVIGSNNGSVATGTLIPSNIISPNINNGSAFNSATLSITPLAFDNTWSVEFWALPNPISGFGTIIDVGDNGIFINSNTLAYYNTTVNAASTDISNRAVHCCLTFDGTTGRFYINGEPDGTFTNPNASWAPIRIGGDSGTENYSGDMQSLSVNDGVLSAQQVREHFLRGVTEGTFVVYSIAGNSKIDNANQPCILRAYRVDNGELAADTLADSQGDYVLENLEESVEYIVMCIPPTGQSTVCPQANGAFLAATDGNATPV